MSSFVKAPSDREFPSGGTRRAARPAFATGSFFRVMVFLDAVTGLRRSELFALRWEDINFDALQINVQRSIYMNVIGRCKTETSRKPVPMDPVLASELWAWKQ